MKYLFILALSLSLCSAADRRGLLIAEAQRSAAAGGGGTDLTTDLLAYYRMEDASGNATDSSGNSRTLTAVNAPGSDAGKLNNARTFVASEEQYFSRADESALRFSTNFTVTAWVYINDSDTTRSIVAKTATGSGNLEFDLRYHTGSGRFQAVIFDQSDNYEIATASTFGAPSINTWHFVAARRSGNTLYISVDGGTEDPETIDTLTAPIGGTAQLTVGSQGYAGSEQYWRGILDEIAIYGRALSTAEISLLYNSGSGRDPVSNP